MFFTASSLTGTASREGMQHCMWRLWKKEAVAKSNGLALFSLTGVSPQREYTSGVPSVGVEGRGEARCAGCGCQRRGGGVELWPHTDLTVGFVFVGCLTSQQHASVSQGRICSDNFTCCHTEIEVADPTFYLTQAQYTDTGPTRPSADPITPGAWQGSHWSANF